MKSPSTCRRCSFIADESLSSPTGRPAFIRASEPSSVSPAGDAFNANLASTCCGARCHTRVVSPIDSGEMVSATRRAAASTGSVMLPSSGSDGSPPSSHADARAPRRTDSEPVTLCLRRLALCLWTAWIALAATSAACATPSSCHRGARGSLGSSCGIAAAGALSAPPAPDSDAFACAASRSARFFADTEDTPRLMPARPPFPTPAPLPTPLPAPAPIPSAPRTFSG